MNKRESVKLLLAIALLIPAGVSAQKKIYTRSYRLQDLNTCTTRIVLDGPDALVASMRDDVTSIWSISPYEFCSPEEYEQQKKNPSLYFLHPVTDKGIVYLEYCKGGDEKSTDPLNTPMSIISFPVCGEHDESSLSYLPAFLSIIQDYAEAATNSEAAAYLGIETVKRSRPRGLKVCKQPDECMRAFIAGDPLLAVQVVITPDGSESGKPRHTIVFNAESFDLYSYKKAK